MRATEILADINNEVPVDYIFTHLDHDRYNEEIKQIRRDIRKQRLWGIDLFPDLA